MNKASKQSDEKQKVERHAIHFLSTSKMECSSCRGSRFELGKMSRVEGACEETRSNKRTLFGIDSKRVQWPFSY